MNTFPYLNTWLQCLLQLAPPRGLLHIGAGGGAQPYPYANMPHLLAVEADALQHARLQTQLQNHAHCQVTLAVVAAKPGTADFFALSQSLESGLCPAAALQTLWPNIKTLHADAVPTTTLQALLTQAPDGANAFNWVVIDCLPADQLLQGGGDLIQGWDVLLVRALKDAPEGADSAGQAMSLAALRQQLAAFDLQFLALEEENHPQMVRALFVRNPAQQLGKETTAKAEALAQCIALAQKGAEAHAQRFQLAQENAKLIADKEELTRARDQLGIQRDAEAKAKAEALAQRDQLAQERAALAAARDEQAKLAADRHTALTNVQAQRDQLAQEKSNLIAAGEELTRARDQLGIQRDAEAKAKAEALAQRDQLAQERAALAVARDEQAKLAAERQAALVAQQKDATSIQQRLQQLEAENQEQAVRQQMLQEELIKAEAQIELIKDLLLREPGL